MNYPFYLYKYDLTIMLLVPDKHGNNWNVYHIYKCLLDLDAILTDMAIAKSISAHTITKHNFHTTRGYSFADCSINPVNITDIIVHCVIL